MPPAQPVIESVGVPGRGLHTERGTFFAAATEQGVNELAADALGTPLFLDGQVNEGEGAVGSLVFSSVGNGCWKPCHQRVLGVRV